MKKAPLHLMRPRRKTNQHEMNESVLTDASGFAVVESCHSVWLFDEENHRFSRVLKGMNLDSVVSTDWRDYDHMVMDDASEAFVVFLDRARTRLLRAWRHVAECNHCGSTITRELSVADIREAAAV